MDTELQERVLKIMNTVLENKSLDKLTSLEPDMHLKNNVGFNSLDLAELTVRIEAEFDVDIFEAGIVNTVGEVLDKLKDS